MQVEQHDVRRVLLEETDRFEGILRPQHTAVTVVAEELLEQIEVDRLVIDQQQHAVLEAARHQRSRVHGSTGASPPRRPVASTRSVVARNSAISSGFDRNATAPAASSRSAVAFVASALITTTGMCAVRSS